MKSAVYSSKYFIIIGVFIFLCFAAVGFFMKNKFGQRTQMISIDMATKIYQLKSNIIRHEFNGFARGLNNAETLLPELKSANDFRLLEKIIDPLLLSHPRINKGWYATIRGRDTVYTAFSKSEGKYTHHAILKYQKEWIKSQLVRKDTTTKVGALLKDADSLHWMIASKHKLADSSSLILGLDVNLNDLQRYLWSVDTTGRASAFVVDENGSYITNPEEKLIGRQMPGFIGRSSKRIPLADSVSSYETANSSYLQLPVVRFYTPLNIGPMKWTMIVDTPEFIVVEDVQAIENYVIRLFVFAAVIVLVLIAWSQAKWQKEFMLRQQVEMKRKELFMEKQELNLISERQQKENALLQLDKLKEKLDPHFLFNSLSSLNGLIEEQPDLAKSFVVKLSRVYRYVLDPAPDGLAEISQEIRFANEYFFLLRIRFGDALLPLVIELAPEHKGVYLPFMSLQTLIENAVKHNVVSKSKPLSIIIRSEGDGIAVINNLQLRNEPKEGGGQGLNYLQSAYAHFGDLHLQHFIENDQYKSILPVINSPFTP